MRFERSVPVVEAWGLLGPRTVTGKALGIETYGGHFSQLIRRRSRVPCTTSEFFSTTEHDQDEIQVAVFSGRGKLTRDNVLIGRFRICGIGPAKGRSPRILVTLTIDENGHVTVQARDSKTGNPLEVAPGEQHGAQHQ